MNHVRRAAEPLRLRRHINHRHGRFRRNAADFAPDIFVDHHIADHQQRRLLKAMDDLLQLRQIYHKYSVSSPVPRTSPFVRSIVDARFANRFACWRTGRSRYINKPFLGGLESALKKVKKKDDALASVSPEYRLKIRERQVFMLI